MKITIERLQQIVREAARLMIPSDFKVTSKGGFENIVTSSDLAVQDFLCERLAAEMPGSGFICEEEDINDSTRDYTWIIDPIDGTANYARGLFQCAVCVGLKHGPYMEMAVVYLPRTDEMFHAERGKGAYLNGKLIHVSDRPFADSIFCTAFPVYHKEHTAECAKIISEVFCRCNDIRRLGAAAPELCYIAAGRCEMYYEYLLSPWDFAAASLVLNEAGGVLCSPTGTSLDYTRPSGVLAANNPENLSALQTIVAAYI